MKTNTLLFILIFFTFKTFSQSNFEVNISFPENLDNNKVQIKYDAGKGFQQLSKTFEKETLSFADTLYSVYALIEITYSSQKKTFLVNEKPAEIHFSNTDLSKFQLKNAQDLWENGERLFSMFFTAIEKEFKAFFQANAEKLNAGDDSLQKILSQKIHHLNVKRLEFIQKYSEWFYSLSILRFRTLRNKVSKTIYFSKIL